MIKNIWFEFDEWADGHNICNENADVHFETTDGSKWCACFYTYDNLSALAEKNRRMGECLSGQYFYADKPIFISRMEKDLITAVLEDIIENESDLSAVFTRI